MIIYGKHFRENLVWLVPLTWLFYLDAGLVKAGRLPQKMHLQVERWKRDCRMCQCFPWEVLYSFLSFFSRLSIISFRLKTYIVQSKSSGPNNPKKYDDIYCSHIFVLNRFCLKCTWMLKVAASLAPSPVSLNSLMRRWNGSRTDLNWNFRLKSLQNPQFGHNDSSPWSLLQQLCQDQRERVPRAKLVQLAEDLPPPLRHQHGGGPLLWGDHQPGGGRPQQEPPEQRAQGGSQGLRLPDGPQPEGQPDTTSARGLVPQTSRAADSRSRRMPDHLHTAGGSLPPEQAQMAETG